MRKEHFLSVLSIVVLWVIFVPCVQAATYAWHTFYGSSHPDYALDYGTGIATDRNGNVYVTGYSNSPWSGPTGESPLHAFTGSHDILVLKLDSRGSYQWHTFFGSNANDYA